MAQRWTEDEDRFLVAYFDSIGSWIGPHDLGRSEKATIARAKFLKVSGAWNAIIEADKALWYARNLAGYFKRRG